MALQLTTEAREQAGSCNFCQRGRPSADSTHMVFPYTHVAVLGSDLARGTGSMRICPACLADLRQQLLTYALPEAESPAHEGQTE